MYRKWKGYLLRTEVSVEIQTSIGMKKALVLVNYQLFLGPTQTFCLLSGPIIVSEQGKNKL